MEEGDKLSCYAFQMASSSQIKVFSLVFQAASRQETERKETQRDRQRGRKWGGNLKITRE